MLPDTPVLAFDTSAAHCAAALLLGGTCVKHHQETMARGQVERLVPLLEEVLHTAGVRWADLSAIGVGIGPGNFTGIRVSVSAARGLGLSLGIPVVGVSTLEALALGSTGPAICTVDARKGNYYAQRFENGRATNAPGMFNANELPLTEKTGLVTVIGRAADELAGLVGGQARKPGYPLAEAIAKLAASRMHNRDLAPPAPLYLRAADAAPASSRPPVIAP